jgi:ribosomal protein S18 acetylase RimI-like enzyme
VHPRAKSRRDGARKFTIVPTGSFGYQCNVHAAPIQIRRLGPADAAIYRDIRLEALRQSPEAFGSTFETERCKPLAFFEGRISTSGVFGAFDHAALVGVAGLLIREGAKESHKGMLWGMYVRSSARKAGVGRRLVEAVIEFARTRVELVHLTVVSENETARRLYARMGFLEYGIERKALKQGSRYYDEVLMARDFAAESN